VFPDSTKLELASFPARLGVDNLKMYPGSQFVSHSHLMVYCENGLFQVEDTNSLNGTSLNGKVIGKGRDAGGGTGRQPLKDGDWISLAGPFDDKGQGALTFTVRVIQHSGPAPH
jgi:pSer/pThr/pTyr-binding forkhead associated (FHA) protein